MWGEPGQLQCLRSGVGEPRNEAGVCTLLEYGEPGNEASVLYWNMSCADTDIPA